MIDNLKKLVTYDPESGDIIRNSDGKVLGWPDKDGYLELSVAGIKYKAHRLAFLLMTGSIPDIIDHPNGIPSDNRWSNLKSSSHADNMKNCKKRCDNKSGGTGVSWCNTHEFWVAKISGKSLGNFKDLDKAVAARKAAEVEMGFTQRHGT